MSRETTTTKSRCPCGKGEVVYTRSEHDSFATTKETCTINCEACATNFEYVNDPSDGGKRLLRKPTSRQKLTIRDPLEGKGAGDGALGRWELVVAGPWSEGPDHDGEVVYEVGHNRNKTKWALRVRNGRRGTIAVVIEHPDATDENAIVRLLLETAENSPYWFRLEEYRQEGRFKLAGANASEG